MLVFVVVVLVTGDYLACTWLVAHAHSHKLKRTNEGNQYKQTFEEYLQIYIFTIVCKFVANLS